MDEAKCASAHPRISQTFNKCTMSQSKESTGYISEGGIRRQQIQRDHYPEPGVLTTSESAQLNGGRSVGVLRKMLASGARSAS